MIIAVLLIAMAIELAILGWQYRDGDWGEDNWLYDRDEQ